VRLTLSRGDDQRTETMDCGDGPIDAAFLAVEKITGITVTCRHFGVQSVTVGKDAQGEVTVEVEHNGQIYKGRGVSTDSVEASVKAFLNAMNRIAVYRDTPAPIKAQA
jgi:2-isopropylmalate synthase